MKVSRSTVFAVVALVGAYLVAQAIADVGATKFVQVGSIVLPAGSIMFAATFTLRDMLHKRLGKVWAQAAIIMAAVFNVVQAFYLLAMARMQAPAFFTLNDAWKSIFSIVPSITIASILAELVSEMIDTEVYAWWAKNMRRLPQFTRVLASNAVSLPVDSLIFGVLAFVILPPIFGAKSVPFATAIGLVAGQIVYKAIVTGVSLPAIYLVKEVPLDHSLHLEE